MAKFAGQLGFYIQQAGLPLRRVASQSGIPHQTLYNWLKGTQPRWHDALPRDLHNLGATLGLANDEIALLLRLAGCISARSGLLEVQEVSMKVHYVSLKVGSFRVTPLTGTRRDSIQPSPMKIMPVSPSKPAQNPPTLPRWRSSSRLKLITVNACVSLPHFVQQA